VHRERLDGPLPLAGPGDGRLEVDVCDHLVRGRGRARSLRRAGTGQQPEPEADHEPEREAADKCGQPAAFHDASTLKAANAKLSRGGRAESLETLRTRTAAAVCWSGWILIMASVRRVCWK